MTAAVQMALEGTTPVQISERLVEVRVSAPPVEVRVLDPWRIATGGGRPTLRDRYGRRLERTVEACNASAVLPEWATHLLPAVVAELHAVIAASTPAPIDAWSWSCHPVPA